MLLTRENYQEHKQHTRNSHCCSYVPASQRHIQFAFLIHPFQWANISQHQNYISNLRVTASVCIVGGTEHKASLWTAIYIVKTRAMSHLFTRQAYGLLFT